MAKLVNLIVVPMSTLFYVISNEDIHHSGNRRPRRVLARGGSWGVHLQCVERYAQGTSTRRFDRQPGDGLDHGEVLKNVK